MICYHYNQKFDISKSKYLWVPLASWQSVINSSWSIHTKHREMFKIYGVHNKALLATIYWKYLLVSWLCTYVRIHQDEQENDTGNVVGNGQHSIGGTLSRGICQFTPKFKNKWYSSIYHCHSHNYCSVDQCWETETSDMYAI